MGAIIVSGSVARKPWLSCVLAFTTLACASDTVVRVERQRLQELAAQPRRQAELALEINDLSKRPPIQILPRAPSAPMVEARSLSVVTAERIAYEHGLRSTGWLPTSSVRAIRVAHGSQAGHGATIGALVGAGAVLLGGIASTAGDGSSELPAVIWLPLASLAGAVGGALWGMLIGYASDEHTLYELPP